MKLRVLDQLNRNVIKKTINAKNKEGAIKAEIEQTDEISTSEGEKHISK